jgi:hypothetical protein
VAGQVAGFPIEVAQPRTCFAEHGDNEWKNTFKKPIYYAALSSPILRILHKALKKIF